MAGVWHYIPPMAAPGETQMAIDRWLLDQHLQGNIPSVLRFYTWQPAAISLGYHQRNYPEFWENLTYQGEKIDLVRRPSGGRAVLHQGDLTYAIVTSGLTGDRQKNYETLCQFLIAGFEKLGISLSYGQQQRNYEHFDSCFRTHTKADLVTESGYKLIGSAQLRRQGAILQHGSIRLNPDPALYELVFGEKLMLSSPPAPLSTTELIAVLRENLQTCFGVTLQGSLLPLER
ncbi:lipoate--protein ligase family protein [Picosynechococcus sp. NKBG15041c]|uniref:lipoate--protein ligase family protein n=1 Tax=Picosynechococcus sp. NKBG15041c TaxID=1407650 RepID=UPI0003F91E86|nr:lipoate--protein ligase family protein [Picosynechococcus sp. NKBG15041c]